MAKPKGKFVKVGMIGDVPVYDFKFKGVPLIFPKDFSLPLKKSKMKPSKNKSINKSENNWCEHIKLNDDKRYVYKWAWELFGNTYVVDHFNFCPDCGKKRPR